MPGSTRQFAGRSTLLATLSLLVAACAGHDKVTGPTVQLKNNPCGAGGTVQLAVAQATTVDCTNGGTNVTFEGNGASYLIVPEFATDQAANQLIPYHMATANVAAAIASGSRVSAGSSLASTGDLGGTGILPPLRPNLAQMAADRMLRAQGRELAKSGAFQRSASGQTAFQLSAAVQPPPAAGSIRSFHVLSNFNTSAFKTVGAQLAYVGTNILLYVDTLAPANGFTPAQLQNFGQYFDQTLYAIAVNAFGGPSDIDQNGRVIMLMSPVVNADTPASTCASQGFVAGFFDTVDFLGASNPNSNQGEIFYSIVPDPLGTFSCTHTEASLGDDIPATFLHELQHLISYSQHVIVSAGTPGSSWMDEGLSLIAEELGSIYFENKCPPPACRTNPAQIFPDSAQGFVSGFLFDSYQYALLPDTASLTLHDDSEQGFSWRGGDWLLMRWLGDQMGSGFFQKLERGPANGLKDIEQATGQTFPSLFANFGLALHTDSLPGLPRTTAPAVNRFVSRNVKQLWARIFTTSGPSQTFPLANPLQLFAITADTSSSVMVPGTTTFFRLDTPASAATTTIQFSTPAGAGFQTALHPQLAIFRLPPGQ